LEQKKEYQEEILPKNVKKVSLEAGSTFGWHQLIKGNGLAIGIDRFGWSGPEKDVMKIAELTVTDIQEKIKKFFNFSI
jgi:transketolase